MKTILIYIKISLSKSLYVYKLTRFFCLRNQNSASGCISPDIDVCSIVVLTDLEFYHSLCFLIQFFLREKHLHYECFPNRHPSTLPSRQHSIKYLPRAVLFSLSSADTGLASDGILPCDLMMDNLIANIFCIFLTETLLFSC